MLRPPPVQLAGEYHLAYVEPSLDTANSGSALAGWDLTPPQHPSPNLQITWRQFQVVTGQPATPCYLGRRFLQHQPTDHHSCTSGDTFSGGLLALAWARACFEQISEVSRPEAGSDWPRCELKLSWVVTGSARATNLH